MTWFITDHHECKQAIPEAAAVVDPHRPDCPYPFKGLAGVGVALKLAMAAAGTGPGRAWCSGSTPIWQRWAPWPT